MMMNAYPKEVSNTSVSLSRYLKQSTAEEKSRHFEAALKRAAEQQRNVVREARAAYR